MATTYQYQKLIEPDAIRLILLHPSPEINSPLHCNLLSTSLTRCHNDFIDKYTALSYVWGDPTRPCRITVDDEPMYITASLDSALRHLRDRYRKRQVWADAICINQDVFEERNQQVGQMASVYSIAHHTIIFLDEGTPETTRFLDTLQSNASKNEVLVTGSGAGESATDRGSKVVEESALQWILSRPWFRRVWILQELALSKDPWIQCGTSLARWETLRCHITASCRESRAQEELFLSMSDLHFEHLNKPSRDNKQVKQLYDSHRDHDILSKPLVRFEDAGKLFDLLASRKGFGVSDPRDMLFANVGLVPKSSSNHDQTLHLIAVDYEKDEVQVYIDLARYLLETVGDIVFSLLDGGPRLVKDLPPWVPDWTSASDPIACSTDQISEMAS